MIVYNLADAIRPPPFKAEVNGQALNGKAFPIGV